MKNIFKTLWLAFAATTFVACDGPTPEPEPPTPPAPAAIAFSALTANGGATETTTAVTLTFDKVIDGLTAENITLTAGETGTTKGALTAKGSGVYELAVSGIVKGGQITVAVAKANFAITPASKTVTVNFFAAPALNDNSIVFGDEAPLEFKSIVFDETLVAETLFAVVSPVEGLTTYNQVMKTGENGDYINKPLIIKIAIKDLNKTYDVMTEQVAIFSVGNYTGVGSEIEQIMTGNVTKLSAGSFTSTYNAETGDLSISFNVTSKSSGKQLRANVTGNFLPTPPPEGNVMVFNDDAKPIVSKCYKKENGGVTIYLSPFDIFSEADLKYLGYYAKIWVADANIGNPIEILEGATGFTFTYRNMPTYDTPIVISPENLNGAEGLIVVIENAEGEYEVEYDIALGDNMLYSIADGEFTLLE